MTKSDLKARKTILFIFKLPPPMNGATKSNLQIKNSNLISNNFRSLYINYGLSRGSDDFGTIRLQKVWFYFRSLLLTIYYLVFKKVDAVYITISPKGFSFFKDSVFVIFSKLFFRKIIIHMHGKGIRKKAEESGLTKRYYKLVFRNTNVICLSDLLINDIKSIYKGLPFILPNGIPTISNTSKKESISDTPVLLFLSNLYVKKGVLNFVEIIKELTPRLDSFEALIIGGNTKEFSIDELKEIISKEGLSDYIKVLGPLYGSEKDRVFNSADIFVFPTEWPNEAFPIVLLEALQNGIPIIASPEGGIPDIITENENGFIVDSRDYKAYSERILDILENNSSFVAMSERNIIKFNRLYTIQTFEENLNLVFNKVLSN